MKTMFTLVELMIVVAIIALLAAIAIPVYQSFQARTRETELYVTLDGIETQAAAWVTSETLDLATSKSAPRQPNEVDRTAVPWVDTDADWTAFHWVPDGAMRCSYTFWLSTGTGASSAGGQSVEDEGFCDVDGDGIGHELSRGVHWWPTSESYINKEDCGPVAGGAGVGGDCY